MKNITKLLCAGAASVALALGLTGCEQTQMGVFEGYVVEYSKGKIILYSKEKGEGKLYFTDYGTDTWGFVSPGEGDGRFDQIELYLVRPGDPIEKYASLEVAQKIAESLKD